jgi:hypothetical protein
MIRASDKYYVAVRQNAGGEWFDMSTIAWSVQVSMQKAERTMEDEGPGYTADNPIVRYATVEIKEVR